jgi:lipoic acid synthetase
LFPDPEEPERIAAAVDKLKLRYVVITSVTRDDLPDGGASQFAQTLRAIHEYDPYVMVEVLIPDFNGSLSALQKVTDTFPTDLNHNVETVSSLYPEVRPEADYRRSIRLLEQSKLLNNEILTKSGFMLGLGEVRQEVIKLMINLREVGCDLLTIGQYLQPSLKHHKITGYIPPEEFEEYVDIGRQLGFRQVTSGPLVRSSFHAAEAYLLAME